MQASEETRLIKKKTTMLACSQSDCGRQYDKVTIERSAIKFLAYTHTRTNKCTGMLVGIFKQILRTINLKIQIGPLHTLYT